MINLLADANQLQIHHLHVYLNSQLVVSQFNNVYHVCDPYLSRKYLQVKIMSRNFESITLTHTPRSSNQFVDNITNEILD
jgi:hypothetical protein